MSVPGRCISLFVVGRRHLTNVLEFGAPALETKPVLLSLAALSPMGCGARKDVLQVLQVLR
jgi:hypothetical protein